jgi:hypothetical protein
VREGCSFAKRRGSEYIQKWFPHPEFDCCRLDPSSPVDHYDTSTMALLDDGFPPDHPLRVHHEPELYTYPRPIESYRMSAPPEDIERAAQLPLTDCPRRYCWWWRSLSFDWDLSLEQGCRRHESEGGGTPCCRRDPTSTVDHYEPREPHLMEDGFEVDRFDRAPRP